ncbi:MAG: hypothetical protein ACP5QB_13085 [Thiomonas sp.]
MNAQTRKLLVDGPVGPVEVDGVMICSLGYVLRIRPRASTVSTAK